MMFLAPVQFMKKHVLQWIAWASGALVSACVVYAAMRSPREFASIAGTTGTIASVVTAVALIAWMATSLRKQEAAAKAAGEPIPVLSGAGGLVLLIGFGFGIAFAGVAVAAMHTLEAIYRASGQNTIVVATVGVTVVLGSALFFVRLRLRFLYGLSEALIGVAVAGHRASAEQSIFPTHFGFYLAVLTAGVYLVVRGLDNIHQATKDPDDLVLKLIRNLSKNRNS